MKIAWVTLFLELYLALTLVAYITNPAEWPKRVTFLFLVLLFHLAILAFMASSRSKTRKEVAIEELKNLETSPPPHPINILKQMELFHWKAVTWVEKKRPLLWISFRLLTLSTAWALAVNLGPSILETLLPGYVNFYPWLSIIVTIKPLNYLEPTLRAGWAFFFLRWAHILDEVPNNNWIKVGKTGAKLCAKILAACFATYEGVKKTHSISYPRGRDPIARRGDRLIAGYTSTSQDLFERAQEIQLRNGWDSHEPLVKLGVVNAKGKVDPDTLLDLEEFLKGKKKYQVSPNLFEEFVTDERAEENLNNYNSYHAWDWFDEDVATAFESLD